MSWGMAFKELVNGFKTGYEFADQMADAKSEREYREKQASALDIDTQLKELQVGDYEEDRLLERDRVQAGIDSTRAGIGLTQEQINEARYRNSEDWRTLERQQTEAGIAGTRASTAVNLENAETIRYGNTEPVRAREAARLDAGTDYVRSQTENLGASTTGQQLENQAAQEKVQRTNDFINNLRNRMNLKPVTSKVKPQAALPVEGGTSTASANIPADERDLAIRMIAMEAGGEPEEGKQAVANVMLNRARSGRYGRSLKDVITAEAQFEPWATRRDELFALDRNSPAYKNAEYAFEQALQSDVTGGATHFLNKETVLARTGTLPRWARDEGQQIGRHTFLAPEGRVADGAVGADRYAPTAALAYNGTGETMSDAIGPMEDAVARVPDEPWEEAVLAAYDVLDDTIPDRAVTTDEDDEVDIQALEENAVDPEDLETMLDTMEDQGLTEGMSETQAHLALLALARQEALATGDVQKANEVSAGIVWAYREAFGRYTDIAKDLADDGKIEEATEALVRAYSFVPDGMEVSVEKAENGGFTIVQKDVNGEEVSREEAVTPDDMFTLINAQTPESFEKALATTKPQKEGAVPEGMSVTEMGTLMEQADSDIERVLTHSYDTPDAISPDEREMLSVETARIVHNSIDPKGNPTVIPRDVARKLVSFTAVENGVVVNPLVAENEDGSGVYRTRGGEITLSPEEHAAVQRIVRPKIARMKEEAAQPGWFGAGVRGAVEGVSRVFDAPAGQGPRTPIGAVPAIRHPSTADPNWQQPNFLPALPVYDEAPQYGIRHRTNRGQ